MWWKRRERENRELEAELRFHLEQEEQLRRDRGQDPAGARRDFGNLVQVHEITRDQWGWTWLERGAHDARFALRLMRKSPGFALTAILVLALGIGATSAIFTVVRAVLLRPLALHDPERLVMVWERQPFGRYNVIQTQNFLDWRSRNRCFTQIAALYPIAQNLSGEGEPVQIPAMRVTAGFFEILGTPPLTGRTITENDDQPGSARVAVLSYGLWQRRFGGNMDAIGRKINLDGASTEIIGVMPPDFAFPTVRADLWTAMRIDTARAPRDGRNYQSVARLKPGVTPAQAQREMEAIAAQTERERPGMNTKWSALVVPLMEQTVGGSRDTLNVLLGAVLFVLLIACVNVANLLLMRAAGRQREMMVRIALGAGRWRLLYQTAIESLVLALAGGGIGYVLAMWGVPALISTLPVNYPLPRREEIAVDAGILWFTIGVSVVCGFLFGVLPALLSDRSRIAEGLKQGGRTGSGSGRGMRAMLAAVEVAVAVVLVTGAGLMLRSFVLLNRQELGYRPDHVLTVRMTLIMNKYGADLVKRASVVGQMLERVRALPAVESAASIHALPTTGTSGTGYDRGDRPAPLPGEGKGGDVSVISDDYFRTMKVPLVSGREFNTRDRMGSSSVVVLNRSAAKLLFENEDPIGKRLRVQWSGATNPEIVGLVEDMRHYGQAIPPQPTLFVCSMQAPSLFTSLVVRTRGDPAAAASAIKEQIRQVDPEQGAAAIVTMEELVSRTVAAPRLQTILLGAFGGIALLLACVGIYAVIAYSVTQRTRELGIRLALGAAPGAIRRMVLREGMAIAAAGIVAGAAATLGLTRYLTSLLYEVKPADPAVFAAVCAILAASAACGCWFPAHRATSVDPAMVLREE